MPKPPADILIAVHTVEVITNDYIMYSWSGTFHYLFSSFSYSDAEEDYEEENSSEQSGKKSWTEEKDRQFTCSKKKWVMIKSYFMKSARGKDIVMLFYSIFRLLKLFFNVFLPIFLRKSSYESDWNTLCSSIIFFCRMIKMVYIFTHDYCGCH